MLALLVAVAGLIVAAPAAVAAPQPVDITKLTYQPIGHFKPGEPIPANAGTMCDEVLKPLMNGKLFNPSGNWNAFDTNVFETICLPFRNQDDTSADDPWGNGGEARHGYCAGANPADPLDPGVCPGHTLEYIDYYKATMLEILKDFSPTFHEYTFEHSEGLGRNPAVVIAGSDHPEENIIIGSHYDQTETGPASTWDSAEGHAEMIRIAKLMADYWKSTGTRPSATVKFVPMDAEEDGLLGSAAYVDQVIPPDQESKVRSYWNADPCAGGYPARKYGNPADTVPLNVQIGDSEDPRVVAFNQTAPQIVEETFEHLDDRIESYPDQPERFISTEEGGGSPVGSDIGKHVFITKEHPVLFGSDWTNFIALNIPFFNPSPKVTGPSEGFDEPSLLTVQSLVPEALVGFHTPIDNLQTMARYTGQTPAGNQWPEAWMKGMEMCSHMLAYGMLQPNAGGAAPAGDEVVAYYEALPNEAEKGKFVTFNAGGSHQYANPATRELVPDSQLQFKWNYGDGRVAYGKVVKHAYRQTGAYNSTLTVTNRKTGKSSTMTLPIVVEDGTGTDQDPPGQDTDTLPDGGNVVACSSANGFAKLSVKPAGKGLRFDLQRNSTQSVKIAVYRASNGRKATAPKKVASFAVNESFTWKGKRGLRKGDYFVQVEVVQTNGQLDRRSFALKRTGSKFKLRKPFTRTDSCELISLYRLGAPVFGGKRPLRIAFALTQPGKATVKVLRGKKVVKTLRKNVKQANRAQRLTLKARKLRRGEYKIRITARAGTAKQTSTLYARRLR